MSFGTHIDVHLARIGLLYSSVGETRVGERFAGRLAAHLDIGIALYRLLELGHTDVNYVDVFCHHCFLCRVRFTVTGRQNKESTPLQAE